MYKKVNSFYKKIFALLIILAFYAFQSMLFAADADLSNADEQSTLLTDLDLDKLPQTWLSVLGGKAICRPAKTSYGHASLTDGRMITAFNDDGVVLWQKPIPSMPEKIIVASDHDFLAVPLRNKKLTLLNPNGLVLWTNPIGFETKSAPLFSRDGKIFVFGKENIACFAINGIQKWSIKVAELDGNLKPVEFSDGSIMVFGAVLDDGKTVGIRVSPFGEVLETIIFAGVVLNAFSTTDGILLAFSDGTLGLCAIEDESQLAFSKWVLKDLGLCAGAKFESLTESLCVVTSPSGSGTKAHIVNTKEALLLRSFTIPEIPNIDYIQNTSDGILFAGKTFAVIHAQSGRRVRGFRYPKDTRKDVYEYMLYGQNGVAIFCSKSWKILGWRVLFSEPPETSTKEYVSSPFYERTLFFNAMQEYFDRKTKRNVNRSVAPEDEFATKFTPPQQTAVISMLGLYGTQDSAYDIAKVLTLETDDTVLRAALKAVQDCGYDPEFLIIEALEIVLKKCSPSQDSLLSDLCEAVYSVCRFMGKEAFFKKGRTILSNMLNTKASLAAKENARKTYEKLAQLGL